MKHIRKVSVVRADAVSDFSNAVWRAWQDMISEKGLTLLGSIDISSLSEK